MGFSHFSADGTVFYSYCIKLSVYSLYVSPEASEQMTRTIARGEKTHLNQHLQSRISLVSPVPAPTWTVPRTFLIACSLTLLVDYTECFICI